MTFFVAVCHDFYNISLSSTLLIDALITLIMMDVHRRQLITFSHLAFIM